MPTLDELKARIKEEASKNPDKFFATDTIRDEGFNRGTCSNCGTVFWSMDLERDVCGEPDCSGGYTFIGDAPTEKTFDVVSAWEAFSSFMGERGYTPVDRYPLAARWRDDTEVVRASIYDFQPYVVSGEVDPPANPLVVPQFCFRSNDIDNVGITGRHYTGFIMVGQHAFTPPEAYEQDKYFKDMLDWIIDGMGIPKEEVILHEDSWGGGGNLGACMEFFVRGLELFNQVYMFYEIDEDADGGYRELDTKVLDMGMGHERIVWITHGSETSYEANMKQVVEKLYDKTGVEPNAAIWNAFLPYAGHLNLDEVDDIEQEWRFVADKVGVDVDELQDEIMPAAALYAVADHARCLLVALNDGLLPSNKGERHALRVMARRCFEFIDRYNWNVALEDVLEWHADEFGALYPELQENVSDIKRIVRHERQKYEQMKDDAGRIIEDLGDDVATETLVELYDSHGITPDMLQRHGVDVDVPQNFYKLVAERHADENGEDAEEIERVDVAGTHKTDRLYFEDEYMQEFTAEVVAVTDNHVVLDETAFYPTSGGQEHDTGLLNGERVVDVIDQNGVILHKLDPDADLPAVGETVTGEIDWERRTRLRKHHTATHLINGAAREILGNHVWQAGSHKSEEKARLDITHYEKLDRDTLQEIEDAANARVVEDLPVTKAFLPRTEAEQRYGFRIYQGGAVPGKMIRVVRIEEPDTDKTVDVEACGGTHCQSTGEVETIRVIGSRKIQDGTIRIEYVAGQVAEEHEEIRDDIRSQVSNYVETEQPLEDIAETFSVEIEQLPRIVKRFVEEWEERKEEINRLKEQIATEDEQVREEIKDIPTYGEQPQEPERLFKEWKQMEKDIETLTEIEEMRLKEDLHLEATASFLLIREIDTDDVGLLIRAAKDAIRDNPDAAILLRGNNAVIGVSGENDSHDMVEEVGKFANTVQGDASFAKGFNLKDTA